MKNEFIPLAEHYQARPEEIRRVWKLITNKRTISTRQIAAQMNTSCTRAFHMINYLKKMGVLAAHNPSGAWDLLISYVEQ